jgi:hypothetical protein
MSFDLLWFIGAPLAGGACITAGIIVPRLKLRGETPIPVAKDGARVLKLRARPTGADSVETAVVVEAPASSEATLLTGEAGASEAAQPAHITAEASAPSNVARPAFGVRMATGLRSAFRRKRDALASALRTHDQASDDAAPIEEGTADVEPVNAPVYASLVPHVAIEEPKLEAPVLETPRATPLVAFEPEPEPRPADNGIVDVDVPAGEDHDTWRAAVAAREATLRVATDEAQRVRDESARDQDRREVEAAAHARQVELENIAIVEEVRVRSEARARKWFARLDLDQEAPTVEGRMMMASSLAAVRAAWAGKLLREAFGQEDEARVRARIIGALVSGDHLDVTDPFYAAFDNGGIERAATFEMLMPRQHEAQWIVDLLAPLLVA